VSTHQKGGHRHRLHVGKRLHHDAKRSHGNDEGGQGGNGESMTSTARKQENKGCSNHERVQKRMGKRREFRPVHTHGLEHVPCEEERPLEAYLPQTRRQTKTSSLFIGASSTAKVPRSPFWVYSQPEADVPLMETR